MDGVNWIMGCISSLKKCIMINGTPTSFFAASRGIHQGFPLSPLLFLLVIEGIGLLIKDAQRKGKIKGIKVSSLIVVSHLLFVDDVVLFGIGNL